MIAIGGQMAGDHHGNPAMRSFRRSSLAAFRRSSFSNLYQSCTGRRKASSIKKMTDTTTSGNGSEVVDKDLEAFCLAPTVSIKSSSPDEDEAGPSSKQLSRPVIRRAPGASGTQILRRAESHSSFLARLSGRLRRSFHLSSSKREQTDKVTTSSDVASGETSTPILLFERTFTGSANITIDNNDEAYSSIEVVQQVLRRNRSDEIKRLLRKTNWPVGHEVRANLWQAICRSNNADFDAYRGSYGPETYGWEELDGNFTPKVRFLLSPDTIKNNYQLNPNGLAALHRLIRALDDSFPTLNYAPMIRPILALFLHYMNEEDAYACAFRILKNHLNYMKDSAVANTASSYTLLALVKIYKVGVYRTMKNWIGSSDESVLAKALHNWPKWIFCYLSFEYLICIIDCYLYEGYKLLMRIAITLLNTWHKNATIPEDLCDKTYEERVDLFMTNFQEIIKREDISITALLEAAKGIRNFSSAKIARLQEKYEKIVLETEGSVLPIPDIPAMHTKPFISFIISPEIAFNLMCQLPERYQLRTPLLIYHLFDDGTSFSHLWSKIDKAESTLMVIKTDKDEVLGAYCDEAWENRTKAHERESGIYFGGGRSFVWNLNENDQLNIFRWQEDQAECFMAAPYDPDPVVMMIGGNAIYIRDQLLIGSSLAGNTFRNPELVNGGTFKIKDLEVNTC
ncbi:unnamed protein product [Thelazia callipaeda]|uniref:TLDc domain-containing protein n=1 Tax=Thelazia callipaeda TaxID=103827 RepID=A0A0N5CWB4_THECL|nr:unnamed protein product [Thelazia callipaeda]